jgi:hypothetical protein
MPTMDQLLAAPLVEPVITMTLGGRRVDSRRIMTATVNAAYGQGVSSATVEIAGDLPVEPRPETPISWSWGYEAPGLGRLELPGFTGYVVTPEDSSYPDTWQLQCADVLWKSTREQQDIATSPLNDVTAQAAIQQILATFGGNPRAQIPVIGRPSNPSTAWRLGLLTSVAWTNTTAYAAIQDIAGTAGLWAYADAGGTARLTPIERRPSGAPARVLTRGDAAVGGALLVDGAPVRRQDGNQVRNEIRVEGAATGVEGALLFDVFRAPHALYAGVVARQSFALKLLEYIADVTAVAQRLAGVYNRVPNTVEGRLRADPRLRIGQTIGIRDPGIRYTGTTLFFLYSLVTTLDRRAGKFDQRIVLDGGVGSSGYSLLPPPVAAIRVEIDLETLDGVPVAVVSCDGSGSYAPDGTIESSAWSTSTSVVSGTATTATGPRAVFVFPQANSPATISLTVTSTNSKTDTATITLPLTGDPTTVPQREALIVAGGSIVSATGDGGQTWRDEVQTTTLAAQGAGVWPGAPATDAATYGATFASTTQVRRTRDLLASASEARGAATTGITALFTNPLNAIRQWRARGTALERSLDGGATWGSWGMLPASITCIVEDPALANSLIVAAGGTLYNTFRPDGTSPGTSWATLWTAPSGATIRWVARSDDGQVTWVALTGSFSGSPLRRIDAAAPVSVTFPSVSPTVSEIRGVALTDAYEPASPRVVAIDQAGRVWVADALTGVTPTQAGTLPAGTAQHIEASRLAPVAYVSAFDSEGSGTGGVYKAILGAGTSGAAGWLGRMRALPSGAQAHMTRLATAGVPVPARFVLLPRGASGGADRLWRYDPTTNAWTAIVPPQSGWYWDSLVVNPFNVREWLLIGNSDANAWIYGTTGQDIRPSSGTAPVLYATTDAGQTWTGIALSGGDLAAGIGGRITIARGACWLVTGGWIIAGGYFDAPNINRGRIWRGAGATVTSATTHSTALPLAPIATTNGRAIVLRLTSGSTAGMLAIIETDNSLTVPAGSSIGSSIVHDTLPPTPGVVSADNAGNLRARTDVASGQPPVVATGAGGGGIAGATHGAYALQTGGGIARTADVLGTPVVTTVANPGSTYSAIRAGQRDRQIVAALDRAATAVAIGWTTDGVTWQTILGPAGMTDGNTAPWIEVIEEA